jgi:hypothetical protein
VVARAIERALTARRPKTRYAVGGGAKPLLLVRRLVSDRMFDRLMWAGSQATRNGGHDASIPAEPDRDARPRIA